MINAVIVDDEYYALQGLKMELEEIGGVQVAGIYEDGGKLLEDIYSLKPDVVFLDIEMPGINGLELFEKVLETGLKTEIVFITAYSNYAVKAFELNAVDYIVKPVIKNRLIKALERIKPESVQQNNVKIAINCFGHFSVEIGGQEINKGWRTRKAEELLAYLLCENGNFVSKEKIAAALWPELDGEKGISNLYLAFYYLKKQEKKLGITFPIESERGKMRLKLEDIDSDLIEFNRLSADDANSSNKTGTDMIEKAVELYKGVLLDDGYYSWSLELQQRYEILYSRYIKRLMEYYSERKDKHKFKYFKEKLEKMLK